ncbi:MAG TPA: PDZ domain-containing protein [Verrucomicrobiae bacterium]|nr:PDZ domain-containing protein [Verrucomicrobiae bacterium]
MKIALTFVSVLVLCSVGCQSKPTPKATLSRGWIGGEYKSAQRKLIPKGERSRVYVQQVFAGTPADQAGLRRGDLLVKIGGEPVRTLSEFRSRIGAANPGTQTTMEVYREGQRVGLPLTIGREMYQEWKSVRMGLGFSSTLDLWPNPEFTLLPIAQYKRPAKRVELRSAERALARQAAPSHTEAEPGVTSPEGWSAWFLILGFEQHKQILSQEPVEPPSARR